MQETSLVIGQIIAVATEVAGGRRGAALAGPGGTSDCRGCSLGWPRWCACQCGGPPHPS